jgi:hypothetical protein
MARPMTLFTVRHVRALAANALEWSQFAFGQLVALGMATFLLGLFVLLFSLFG